MLPIVVIFLFGLIGIMFISAIVYIISKLVIDNRTNKALANGSNEPGRKMLSPVRATSIVAGVLLAGLIMVCICYSLFSLNTESVKKISAETANYEMGI